MDDLNKSDSRNCEQNIDQINDVATEFMKTEMVKGIEREIDSVVANIGQVFRLKLEEALDLIVEETCTNHHIVLLKNDKELKGVLELFSWSDQSKQMDKSNHSDLDVNAEVNECQTGEVFTKYH